MFLSAFQVWKSNNVKCTMDRSKEIQKKKQNEQQQHQQWLRKFLLAEASLVLCALVNCIWIWYGWWCGRRCTRCFHSHRQIETRKISVAQRVLHGKLIDVETNMPNYAQPIELARIEMCTWFVCKSRQMRLYAGYLAWCDECIALMRTWTQLCVTFIFTSGLCKNSLEKTKTTLHYIRTNCNLIETSANAFKHLYIKSMPKHTTLL